MKAFPAIRIEGGLFAPDILERLWEGDLPGQKPQDFSVQDSRNFTNEVAAIFADAQSQWNIFKHRLERLDEKDTGTSITRKLWMTPFFQLLDYELEDNRRAYQEGGLSFFISHRAGKEPYAPPVHIVSIRQDLGKIHPSGRPRMAPHSLVQEFLNRTEALWGIVTNGKILRLLRDSTYIRRQAYVEFDLEAIFEQRLFQDFMILFRLLHRSRLPRGGDDAYHCWLEHYYQLSVEQGGRIREKLREGVEACIFQLANGFLSHPANEELRKRLTTQDDLSSESFYRELLRLIYRFLFLLVSEDRGLISRHPLYVQSYSLTRFRQLINNHAVYTEDHDLWLSLRVLWKILSDDTPRAQLGNKPFAAVLDAPVLDGELFHELIFDTCLIRNRDLLEALKHLLVYRDSPAAPLRTVNYTALDVEELGSVYESLLDYHPRIIQDGGRIRFELMYGSERKSTGSYYTPAELVNELIHSTLDPVIKERLEGTRSKEEKERALLSIKVIDPAAGSGHFLLAAARRLGKELARIRSGESEPPPEQVRRAIRDVVSHCIYGVDKNPLAVELCKVALWLEAHCEDKPLTFLDHRIKCGDSLVGVFDLTVLNEGIPDEAFTPVSGDDRKFSSQLKRRNRNERNTKQLTLYHQWSEKPTIEKIAQLALELDRLETDTLQDIQKKKQYHEQLKQQSQRERMACDLWTAAFFQERQDNSTIDAIITTETIGAFLENGHVHPRALASARVLANRHRFFHWPLEFPEVFKRGGFDVVLGNPPWERIKLQEQEFFSTRDTDIARAPNAAARRRLIQKLPETNPELWEAYHQALHTAESTSRFLRNSGFFPLTGRGDINTYSVFAERMRRLLRPNGRAGIIVPTGIATDDTNKYFFADLLEKGGLVSLFDFENREKIFPAIDSRYKFCLLSMRRESDFEDHSPKVETPAKFAFFCTRTEHLRDSRRVFTLSAEDIARINPNTRTLPVFRTRQDAELTRAIYQRVPVLVNERTGENPWGVRFLRMFDMSNDSHLFRTRELLEAEGYVLRGNRFLKGTDVYLPLYEAKMIWHYDHRFGTYEDVSNRSSTHLPTPDRSKLANPAYLVQSWYLVSKYEVNKYLKSWNRDWMLVFRKITNNTNERTVVLSIINRTALGENSHAILPALSNSIFIGILLGNLNSLVSDWIARQKVTGINLTGLQIRQFALISRSNYNANNVIFIIPRIIELVFTAWDIKSFADDVWKSANHTVRAVIKKQWEANKNETGGHTWDLPEWIEAYPEIETDPKKGIPFPPFKWDEDRRARLQAELDAYYAKLYGLTRKQLRYILDPADLTKRELEDILDPWEEVDDPLDPKGYEERVRQSDFPGETFRVLKEKEIRKYGEYRTRRLVLEAWESLKN